MTNPYAERNAKAVAEGKKNIRYMATYRGADGLRYLCAAAQGCNTYATAAECQAWIDAALKVNSHNTLVSLFNDPKWIKVTPVACWPGHNDPMGTVFGDIYTDKAEWEAAVEKLSGALNPFDAHGTVLNAKGEAIGMWYPAKGYGWLDP